MTINRTFAFLLVAASAACAGFAEPPCAAWDAGSPRIKGPKVFGSTPGRSFTYTFQTCGDLPEIAVAVPVHGCRAYTAD